MKIAGSSVLVTGGASGIGLALAPEMNGPDGFHPNAAGARRSAETVWPYREPLATSDGMKRSA